MEEALKRLKLEDDPDSDEESLADDYYVELGFVQQPAHAWLLQRQHFPCKAGGVPAWLDPVNLPSMVEACCGICEEPLQFLLQVYAQLDKRDDTFHRSLFVFTCTKMACLKSDQAEQQNGTTRRSVKVFRSQLPRKNDFYLYEPPTSENDQPLKRGVELCSWCGTWRGEKICGGCKRMRYCSRKHQVQHWRHSHSSACKNPEQAAAAAHSSDKIWKELEVRIEEEEPEEEENVDENPLQVVPKIPEEIPAELQEIEEASREDQFWASFQARISRGPGQVLRYCRAESARPLWMRVGGQPSPGSILPCPRCGGPRAFEFQVLPQLLYYFGVENEVHSLDWGTIAVYTCSESCPVEGYVEELPWVQL